MEIGKQHPAYLEKQGAWRMYRDLYCGGEQLKEHAAEYMVQRHREPTAIYQQRLAQVFYENYIGSIVDWYAATLFRREPMLSFSGENERARQFFCEFAEDCDRRQTALSDFFRRLLTDALVTGASYALVDFPRAKQTASSRAEEDAWGLSRAYLSPYSAEDLIHWQHDADGGFEWVVLRTSRLISSPGGGETATLSEETRWQYFDRQRFRTWRQSKGSKGEPELVDEGTHGFAPLNRVPLFELRFAEGLWLLNKAALLQLEHFNKSNALSWALGMGLFATPVVYSEREFDQTIAESYYVQLGPNDRFGWTEPEGHVFQIAVDNLTRLKDEIYRVCYLMPQARDTGAPASALSKQRNFGVTQEVLRAYGDAVKDLMKKVLRGIAAARQDGLAIDVSGLDEFDIGDFGSELEDAERLLKLGIPSPTLKREVFKKLAHKYLCDVRQEVKDRVSVEIEQGCGDPG